ncbi:MAG: hypothetical protein AAFN77_19705 [Planctomycetota bacterium]
MSRYKKIIVALAIVAAAATLAPSEANADGPLRRWWRNLTGRNNNCACQNQYSTAVRTPVVAGYQNAQNAYNLQPGQCMQTCQKTCTRTVVNYVSQTAYRTVYNRVPVTQYRPVTNSDPCTGCTVTCMRPCTTYTYQVQRVPYTTYRPVYRQESYRVPVTTITNDCATGNCGTVANGCATCGPTTGVQNFAPQTAPTPATTPAPSTSIYYEPANTNQGAGSFRTGTPVPADTVPSLNGITNPQSSQRPVFQNFNPSSGGQSIKASSPTPIQQQLNQPVARNYGRTAASPIRKDFGYSPIRMASSRTQTTYTAMPSVQRLNKSTSHSRWIED